MSASKKIDFRSDTVTSPSSVMREAMATAVVGDDVYGEDPTVNKLEQLGAETLGKEAALFVPSGTMGNLIAIMAHCGRGQEVIVGHEAHIFFYEAGGASVLGGVPYHTVQENALGKLTPQQIQAIVRDETNVHFPLHGLLCLENTHNRAGGTVSTAAEMKALADVAHSHGIKTHLDGARLFNAAIALNVPVSDLCAEMDSVQLCLSKGLGAPVGSLLAGPAPFIAKARKLRKMLGGGMRQAGVLAAACVIALTEGPKRLHVDHENCKKLATGLAAIPGFKVNMESVQTNMVYVDVADAGLTGVGLTKKLAEKGVLINPTDVAKCRFVTHLDVSEEDIEAALKIVAEVVAESKTQ